MKEYYLAIDAGTSGVKAAIFDKQLEIIKKTKVFYSFLTPDEDFVEMDFNLILASVISCIKGLGDELKEVVGIGLSVLCPGLVPMDKNGDALCNAIIHLDKRSKKEALNALGIIGQDRFLSITGNLPFPGGISLTSMMWLKNNARHIYKGTYKFGHTNTFLLKQMTDSGNYFIDPTNASFTGLYKTVDLSGWDEEICKELKIDSSLLPSVQPCYKIAGFISKGFSISSGLKAGIPVITGAADTSCAVFGAGLMKNGDILNTTGTVEAVTVTLDKPWTDKKLLLRAHVLEDKWLSMFIIGAGGASFEWARNIFFTDMDKNNFYCTYLPGILKSMNIENKVKFIPNLCGDRHSMLNKKASFLNLSLNSNRDDFIRAVAASIIKSVKNAIKKFSRITDISGTVYYTGQGSSFLYEAKKKHFYPLGINAVDENSALKGAAKLVKKALAGTA